MADLATDLGKRLIQKREVVIEWSGGTTIGFDSLKILRNILGNQPKKIRSPGRVSRMLNDGIYEMSGFEESAQHH